MTNFIHGLQLLTAGRVKFVKKLKRSKKLRKKAKLFCYSGEKSGFQQKISNQIGERFYQKVKKNMCNLIVLTETVKKIDNLKKTH